ncbi:hypothetical protein PFISCL1PPCAC_9999, partial [Pristionchus fissidentatus]
PSNRRSTHEEDYQRILKSDRTLLIGPCSPYFISFVFLKRRADYDENHAIVRMSIKCRRFQNELVDGHGVDHSMQCLIGCRCIHTFFF